MEEYMDSSQYIPSRGFWVITAFVISVTVFVVVLAVLTPSDKGIFVQYLALTLDLAIISGSCVGFVQVLRMPHLSSWAKARWIGITILSTTIGWFIVFAFGAFLGQWLQAFPTMSDRLVPAIFYGFLIGASMGATIGFVTGFIQIRFQPLSARQWIVGNLFSWSIGIGVPLTVFFAFLSQAT